MNLKDNSSFIDANLPKDKAFGELDCFFGAYLHSAVGQLIYLFH